MPDDDRDKEGAVDEARKRHDEDLTKPQRRILKVRTKSERQIEEWREKLHRKIEKERDERRQRVEAIKARAAKKAAGQVSELAAEFIADWEGWEAEAYQDLVGVWTIGYGHTGSDVHSGMRINTAEGLRLLAEDAQFAADAVDQLVVVDLNEKQQAAVISFTFNCGTGALAESTLLRRVNARESEAQIRDAFLMWVKAGGATIEGLVNRRTAEAELFNS